MHNRSAPVQRGFSLVELMVALLLGVVLTSGVISVFITSKGSYSLNNAVGQVQEAGRYALTTLEPIVSMAGFSGCTNTSWGKGYDNILTGYSTEPIYNLGLPVYGFEFTGTGPGTTVKDTTNGVPVVDTTATDWTPNISTGMQTAFTGAGVSPVKYSDMLMVHEELGNPAVLTGDDGTTLSFYASTTTPPMAVNDLAVVSSCLQIESFQITGETGSPGTNGTITHANSGSPGNDAPVTPWNNPFDSGNVGRAQTYLFFVGKGVDGGYSLYEASLADGVGTLSNVREIVPGVENMQVLYGVDLIGADITPDNVPDGYVTADNVTNWNQVVSVRVALMVRSDDDAIDKSMTPSAATGIQMLGVRFSDATTYYPAADRRIHRYFVETISLRNSLR